MERQIKFRAFDTEENKYFEPVYEAYKGKLEDLSVTFSGELMRRTLDMPAEHESMFKGRYILEQFTGLLDKNGVEIYEGDIMQWPNQDEKGVVIYDENGCQFRIKLNDYESLHIGLNIGEKGQAIVIGNIHTKS